MKKLGQLQTRLVACLRSSPASVNELSLMIGVGAIPVSRSIRALFEQGVVTRVKRPIPNRWEYVYSLLTVADVVDIEDAVFEEIKEI